MKEQIQKILKKYTYSDDISINDLANMLARGKYPVDYVSVYVDDEYTYGQGRYSLEGFLGSCDGILSVSTVVFNIDALNAQIFVSPDDRHLSLYFDDAFEMPSMEITDIINE